MATPYLVALPGSIPMIAYDMNAPHVRAFNKWRSYVADAKEGRANEELMGAIAALWQMRYVCYLAQELAKGKPND